MKFVIHYHHLKYVAGVFLFIAFAAQAAEPDFSEIIKYRKGIMKAQREHMAAASAIIQHKVEFREQLADHIQALEATTKVISQLFPKGSDAGETGALNTIWENSAEFEKRAADTREKAAALVRSVKSGDVSNYSTHLTELLDSCKSCHKVFRKKDEK